MRHFGVKNVFLPCRGTQQFDLVAYSFQEPAVARQFDKVFEAQSGYRRTKAINLQTQDNFHTKSHG